MENNMKKIYSIDRYDGPTGDITLYGDFDEMTRDADKLEQDLLHAYLHGDCGYITYREAKSFMRENRYLDESSLYVMEYVVPEWVEIVDNKVTASVDHLDFLNEEFDKHGHPAYEPDEIDEAMDDYMTYIADCSMIRDIKKSVKNSIQKYYEEDEDNENEQL